MVKTFHRSVAILSLACAAVPARAPAQSAFFDLIGPDVEASVTRGDTRLPLSQVPGMAAGDRLRIRAILPPDQSERYLLVVGFLRGATNPPPETWFHRARTWRRDEQTIDVIVPDGAQQAIVFLAPNTGGGFDAIRDAVRGRPGIFVRAARDLGQASLDRSRLDAFVAGVQRVGETAPESIQAASTTLARSLAVQLDAECLRRQPRSQAACLTQSRDSIVLYNSRGTSLAETLTGAPADLAYRVSTTPAGGAGAYSPYISVVRDIGRLLGAFQTAEYQYIPALTVGRSQGAGLLLNTAPSFAAPQSVMVAALPPIGTTPVPPRVTPPAAPLCAADPRLLIPVEEAPLLYSTTLARDLTLRIWLKDGRSVNVPMVADGVRGGLVPAPDATLPRLSQAAQASLQGSWGFDRFSSSMFELPGNAAGEWRAANSGPLPRGRDATVSLTGGTAACFSTVTLRTERGVERALEWTVRGSGIDAAIPAAAVPVGAATLIVRSHGVDAPVSIPLGAQSRPSLTLVGKSVERPRVDGRPIILTEENAIPATARLTFSVAVAAGERFLSGDVIELRSESGSSARLTSADGYRLQDPRVAVASFRPVDALGTSAFGPLSVRLVRSEVAGEWQPLGSLVRLPQIDAVTCEGTGACRISGRDLFLIAAVASDANFAASVPVPSGYTAATLAIPAAANGVFHVRLRDAPNVTGTVQVRQPD